MKKTTNSRFKAAIAAIGILIGTTAFSQARVQIIHNSADAATQTVDVYAGSTLLLDDFQFRNASAFIDVAAGSLTIGVAPSTSTSVNDTLTSFPLTLVNNETYVVVANGIFSPMGYIPAPAVTLDVFAMGREEATIAGNTDVLVAHGSTDAPTVDVRVPGLATPVVDDASYGDFAGYLELANADYTLNITDATGSTVVKSYTAPLATLGLADSAIVVVASGFLDPSVNSNGEPFGLWVALPEGGALVELPESQARLQVIHNSADAAAAFVDVYFNGDLLIDDFAFRTASAFIDVPGEVENSIAIAPSTSTDVSQALVTVPATFAAGETFVAVANGIISTTGYAPATAFSLDVFGMGREEAAIAGNTDVLVFHGSTDAPTVDVSTPGGSATPLVDDASYGDFAGYLELPNADYTLNVTDATGATVVKSYGAPLAGLNLADSAIVVVASGFLDPSVNSNGEAFGLWVALPEGGALIELPESQARLQVIHNSADAAAALVDIYFNGDLLIDDFAFRTASAFIDVPAEVENSIAVAPSTSTDVSQAIATIPATFAVGETFVAIANGIVSPTGYTPAQAFSLDVFAGGREAAAVAGNTDLLVFHGSTDAPTVDVVEVNAGLLVDDISYGNYATAYLELANLDYTLNITDASGATVVKAYEAPLNTLGLANVAAVVVASGFLDPSVNSNGEDFGLWVALPAGGALVELPEIPAQVARLQVIHNSADAAASVVDVYLDGDLVIDDFFFRTASPFIDVQAGSSVIDIAPNNSTSVNQSIANFPVTFVEGETYIAIANGIVSATGYAPTPGLSIDVFTDGREAATTAGNTDVLVFHGSTDAPTVDVDALNGGNLVDDASYGDFAGYLELATADYTLQVKDQTGASILFEYAAPLATLGLQDAAITVIASGFVDPLVNSNGADFGLWAATTGGGALVELPSVNTASVSEFDNNLSIFPNPTTGTFQLNGIENGSTVEIFDISGKRVLSELVNDTQVLSLEGMNSGTYMVSIQTSNQRVVRKIVLL